MLLHIKVLSCIFKYIFLPKLDHYQIASIEENLFLHRSTKLLESLSRWFVPPAIFPLRNVVYFHKVCFAGSATKSVIIETIISLIK